MSFTNNLNLPTPLVRAVTNDPYDRGDSDFTVTELITPPRILALEHKHTKELVEDVSDRLWALVGQIGHLIIERSAMKEIVEHRMFAERLGKKISGQVDLLEITTAIDFKFTSIWTSKNGVKPEWEQQLNLLALLARENGIEVKAAQIVAIYRDWSVGEARRNRDYPQTQVQVFPVKLWHEGWQEDFLLKRITAHEQAKTDLPECSPLERWARPEKWAVMKVGAKRAIKLFDSAAEAKDAANTGAGHFVEHRPGVQTRCEDYCAVAKFCTWWQDYQKGGQSCTPTK